MKSHNKSRRGRIVDLLSTQVSDVEILKLLDNEFPPAYYKTSHKAALYGTRYDLELKKKRNV